MAHPHSMRLSCMQYSLNKQSFYWIDQQAKWFSVEQFEDVLLGMAILKVGIQLIGPFVSAKNVCEPILQNHKLCLFYLSLYIFVFLNGHKSSVEPIKLNPICKWTVLVCIYYKCVCVCVCVCMFMWFMRTQICIMTWVWHRYYKEKVIYEDIFSVPII